MLFLDTAWNMIDNILVPRALLTRGAALAKSKTGYHKNMVKEYIRY